MNETRRTGSWLLEVLIAMSLTTMLMSVAASWLGQTMRLAATSRYREATLIDWQRLSRRVRDDVASARSVSVNDDRLVFTVDDEMVVYEIDDGTVRRTEGKRQEVFMSFHDRRCELVVDDDDAMLRMGRYEIRTDSVRWTHRLIIRLRPGSPENLTPRSSQVSYLKLTTAKRWHTLAPDASPGTLRLPECFSREATAGVTPGGGMAHVICRRFATSTRRLVSNPGLASGAIVCRRFATDSWFAS